MGYKRPYYTYLVRRRPLRVLKYGYYKGVVTNMDGFLSALGIISDGKLISLAYQRIGDLHLTQ